jgi:hypothetical protein
LCYSNGFRRNGGGWDWLGGGVAHIRTP